MRYTEVFDLLKDENIMGPFIVIKTKKYNSLEKNIIERLLPIPCYDVAFNYLEVKEDVLYEGVIEDNEELDTTLDAMSFEVYDIYPDKDKTFTVVDWLAGDKMILAELEWFY